MTTDLRVSVRNTSDTGGTALTPFFTAFHDGSFDVYDLGAASSAGLEALAEDGNTAPLAAELVAADADAATVNVLGAAGPIDTRELAATRISVDGVSNGFFSTAAMLLPSNDAFVGTASALQLFDAQGRFLGAQAIVFDGGSVRDAGTEVNTEEDAAFLNQTAPNTGVTENGVVTVHAGFNGSVGNPVGEGDANILGGTNAFGNFIDPAAADFTLPGAQVAVVHINTVASHTGTAGRDFVRGGRDDDLVDAGDGNDFVRTGRGWDAVEAGDGDDLVLLGQGDDTADGGAGDDLLLGGTGNDDLSGGAGKDNLIGGRGADNLSGGADDDRLLGGQDNDRIEGGTGNDVLFGQGGDDLFVFSTGDGEDKVIGFDRAGDDSVALSVAGIASFADVLGAATGFANRVELDFGGGDMLKLTGVTLADLTADDFSFF